MFTYTLISICWESKISRNIFSSRYDLGKFNLIFPKDYITTLTHKERLFYRLAITLLQTIWYRNKMNCSFYGILINFCLDLKQKRVYVYNFLSIEGLRNNQWWIFTYLHSPGRLHSPCSESHPSMHTAEIQNKIFYYSYDKS